ncbi:MAG: chorismate mutase, partial [Candidatus Pelagibacter sp.]|nr:chorismate mutase [Candidatus Pelagibacter sp.]
RILIILKNISKKSKIKKIDTKITQKIWKSMIRSFIDYEFRNFGKK